MMGSGRQGGRGSHGRRAARRGSRAFTLIELVLSMAVASIIMGALGSAIIVAARAIPAGRTPSMEILAATRGLDQLAEELRYAVDVSEASATAVEFRVADRDGDDEAETIRYEWSGVAGDPLVRTYNGSPTVAIERVDSLSLSYRRRKETATETVTQTVDSGEVLFSAFSSWIGTIPMQTTATISTSSWSSQAFLIDRLSLPADATNIRIHRVGVRLRRPSSLLGGLLGGGGGGAVTVAVHRRSSAGAYEPGGVVGSATTVAYADIPSSSATVDVRLNDVVLSGPSDTALAIVVKGTNSSSAELIYFNSLLAPVDNYVFLWTSNGGSSWQPSSSDRNRNDSPYYVFGSYQSKKSESVEVVSYTMLGASAEVVVGAATPATLRTSAMALNQPEAPPP